MKKLIFFAALVCSMFEVHTAKAQEPVATLEHGEISSVFYGQGSFIGAYNASVNGDQIYLSAGFFDPPASIAKGVKITGAGHFPIEGKQTRINSDLNIDKGADSLRLDGLYINGSLNYDSKNIINYVKVIRCSFVSAQFNLISKNYCSLEECFIRGDINYVSGTNFLLRNSIVTGRIYKIEGNALIDGNIFLLDSPYQTNSTFSYVFHSIIRNNIFLGKENLFYNGYNVSGENTIVKNLFVSSEPETYINKVNKADNYIGIAQANIFVNQTGNNLSYLDDYHLKATETYIGTDGTQVGLYGGLGFKENGTPSNPSIVSKAVASSTDANGNLQINFTVKAQDN